MDKSILFNHLISLVSHLATLEQQLAVGLELGSVTPLHLRALQTLYFGGPTTLGGLGFCLGLSLPNASREIKKLTKLQFIDKSSDPKDRRLVLLELTSRGQDLVLQSLAELEKNFNSMTQNWSAQRMQEIGASAQRLLVSLKGNE